VPIHQLIVNEQDAGRRLDAWVALQPLNLTRSHVQKLIAEEAVLVNGQVGKNSTRLQPGDSVVVTVPEPKPLTIAAEQLQVPIVFQDEHIVVVNKPRHMVTHPAKGNYSGTLVNALLHQVGDLSGINGVLRPGIVHRLDKDTTGLLVVAKHDCAHLALAEQMKQRLIKREYQALAHGGFPADQGTVDAPLARHPVWRKRMAVVPGGRRAVTHYQVLERLDQYTLLQLRLETGRTHQIRVHLAHLGHPVVGDQVYGPRKSPFRLSGQLLHAWRLSFQHPITGQALQFDAPLPADFAAVLRQLRQTQKL
jgi:23S rRNA pseudouridine1911/1915/1917 synthase